jgi:hypothetical protein
MDFFGTRRVVPITQGARTEPVDELRDVILYVERPLARTAGSDRFAYAQYLIPPTPIIGAATANMRAMNIMQPQVRGFMQLRTTQNLGGFQAGQMFRQPLTTPRGGL